MLPFLDAMFQGDVVYEDEICNIKRKIFVDCVGMQSFVIHFYIGHKQERMFTNGRFLMMQLRRLGVSFERGWAVYKCAMR